jgi:hypothetical protein
MKPNSLPFVIVLILVCTACELSATSPTATPTTTSISGMVWNDECEVPFESGSPLPAGCVDTGDPNLGIGANGVLDAGEMGIEGLYVALGEGACPSPGLVEAVTGVDGSYSFVGLAPGTYCISVDALSEDNSLMLIPGGWTAPAREVGEQTVTVAAGESKTNVNFGWDYQEVG